MRRFVTRVDDPKTHLKPIVCVLCRRTWLVTVPNPDVYICPSCKLDGGYGPELLSDSVVKD